MQENERPGYSTVRYSVREKLDISWTEYILLDMVYHLSAKYGFCSKTIRAISRDLGQSLTTTHRTIHNLISRELLIQVDRGFQCGAAYIDCAYLEKEPAPKAVPKRNSRSEMERSKMITSVPKRQQVFQNDSNNRGTELHKNNTRNINTTNVVLGADAPQQYGKPEINDLFSFWETTVGYKLESRLKQNRMACSNLLKKHGADKLRQVIRGVALTREDEYAPRIADFIDLQAKYNQLLAWGRSRQKAARQQVVRIR